MEEMKIIKEYTNEDLGIKSIIKQLKDKRFSVILKDLESGNILPVVRFYEEIEPAIYYARHIVNL